MKKLASIKIDQIRLNLPWDAIGRDNYDDLPLPKEVRAVDRIFKLSWIFDQATKSYGHNGYTTSYNFVPENQTGKISVSWNTKREDMGISINFTGSGKALYENLAHLYGISVNWQKLIKQVCQEYGGHISRIDIATDLINYGFSVNEINKKLVNKQYVFLNKRGYRINLKRCRIIGSSEEAQTLYVGSRNSDAFLRIYNKKLEQSRPNGLYRNIADSCNDWIRVEAEFKHRLARKMGSFISSFEGENIYPHLLTCVLDRWLLIEV